MEIEVQGALQVKKGFFQKAYLSFFSTSELIGTKKSRIVGRGTETEDVIHNRLTVAKEEIEMMDAYDYVVENDEVQLACDRIKAIVVGEHCRRERVAKYYKQMTEVE
ncbi:hypothetical protein GCM10020331_046990 [Ectobacillus funiculus]